MNVIYAEQKYELQGHILAVMKTATVRTVGGKVRTCYKHTPFNYICFVVLQKMYDYLYNYKIICSISLNIKNYKTFKIATTAALSTKIQSEVHGDKDPKIK